MDDILTLSTCVLICKIRITFDYLCSDFQSDPIQIFLTFHVLPRYSTRKTCTYAKICTS